MQLELGMVGNMEKSTNYIRNDLNRRTKVGVS